MAIAMTLLTLVALPFVAALVIALLHSAPRAVHSAIAAGASAAGLLLLIVLYYSTNVSRIMLFWAAFILTRPLGAAVGDFLDKPFDKGGLDFSRPLASAVLAILIILLIILLPQRAGTHSDTVVTDELK